MAKDKPGIIREYLALYSTEQQQLLLVVFCYISFTCRQGAIRYISDPTRQSQLVRHDGQDPSYSTNSFHCSGEWCLQSAMHTTGVYGTTGAGYSFPPMYVFSSNAKVPEDFQIKGAVCEELQIV